MTTMPDQTPHRPEKPPVLGLDSGNGDAAQRDAALRLVTAEGNIVVPGGVDTDESPTVISKSKPSEAIKAASPSFASLRGRKLAHFELLEPIGIGGMAAVLRARDTQLDRFVALKILPPDMAQDAENVRRFHQEARAAARLDHENIARVFYCGEDQRLHFIAFEFVEGVNLRVLLDQRGRLPVAEAVRIILQIATGLEHAASRGVVHRDVKPSNIIISANGRAKLVDMGLARSLEPHHDGGVTQSGVTLGTFDYISPEQALEPREADSRSDVYSLGCTFYHMLTGQAPVPEGTAAKKLHHHQHLSPVDPRQLNPEIPDEVAAVLARMMAKDPKDRYQRPVHLVQHLLQVAQKVGAADNLPEGVLFVDASMPVDPRHRPLLMVSLGALALALVLLLLSLAPPPPRSAAPSKSTAQTDKPSAPKDAAVSPLPKTGSRSSDKVGSERQLIEAIADNKGSAATLFLANNITLSDSGLVLQRDGAHTLTIASKDLEEPKTIRFKYAPTPDTADYLPDVVAGLTVEGGSVTFRNIVFEIEAGETPTRTVAAVGIKGAAKVRFHNCRFVQLGVPQRKFIPQLKTVVPVACVAVDNAGGDKDDRPSVEFDQCFFAGAQVAGAQFASGQAAIAVNGPAEVTTRDCAFKSYGALFHLRGDDPHYGIALKLNRCSAFVINGPAFRLDDKASCELFVENSIFSHPDRAPSEKCDEPDLIRQTGSAEPLVRFEGKHNCYHNLNALWVWPFKLATKLDDFRKLVLDAKGKGDVDSVLLTGDTTIWANATPWKEDSPKEAFRLRPDVREVRGPDDRALGFEKCMDVAMLPLPPLPAADAKLATLPLQPNEKLVDPDGPEKPAAGVFKTLFKALAFAQPGDVVYIRHGKNSREVQVKPTPLDNPDLDVTLKPFPGESAPILTLDKTQDAEAAFFRMYDGKLVVEEMELVVEADQENLKSMTVVYMGGNASCTFKNCLITMRPSDAVKHARRVPLSVVTLADPEGAMKMTVQSPRAAADIHLINSFVRGEGEVLTVRASRPLELEVDNTMLALAGSLVGVQAGSKEAAPGTEAKIRLNHVSALLGEPLLAFRSGKNAKGFIPTVVDAAQNSLFVGLGDRPFVAIDAADFADGSLRDFLVWRGEHNAYSSFEKMLTIRPDDGLPFFNMNNPRWVEYYKETDARFVPAPFSAMTMASRAMWSVGPEAFAVSPDQRDVLSSLGATPSSELLSKFAPSKKEVLTTP
jgi:serine/threonine protein kinase